MGNFKDNPSKPFEVRVPNKIRKRIAMHEKKQDDLGLIESLLLPLKEAVRPRGSLWSRFTNKITSFLR